MYEIKLKIGGVEKTFAKDFINIADNMLAVEHQVRQTAIVSPDFLFPFIFPFSKSPSGRYKYSDGGVSPSENESPEFLFPFIFPSTKSPSGRHNDVEGGVSPS